MQRKIRMVFEVILSFGKPHVINPVNQGCKKIPSVKKFLQIDYSAASNRAYADLIDLRSTGIFKNISLTRGQAHRDFFL